MIYIYMIYIYDIHMIYIYMIYDIYMVYIVNRDTATDDFNIPNVYRVTEVPAKGLT